MNGGGDPRRQEFIGKEHFYGTARGQVILLTDMNLYVIAMKDKFGVDTTMCGSTPPSDRVIQAALLRHTHISQVRTGRN